MPKMNANFIKIELLKYFRFDRQFELCFTEGINKSDVNAVDVKKKCLVEVEVKISKSDFLKEFDKTSKNKTKKHTRYRNDKEYKNYIKPNYFYFCVTPELYKFVVEYLQKNGYKEYGVLVCYDKRVYGKRSCVECKLNARKLHNGFTQDVVVKAYKRLSSEIIGLKEKVLTYCKK